MDASPRWMFEMSQMTAPAGMANSTALQRMISVRSITDVYSVWRIRGGRYGGSSRENVVASPFNTVRERPQDVRNMKRMPRRAMPTTAAAETKPAYWAGTSAPMKMVAIRI